jgi:hypothetical protein
MISFLHYSPYMKTISKKLGRLVLLGWLIFVGSCTLKYHYNPEQQAIRELYVHYGLTEPAESYCLFLVSANSCGSCFRRILKFMESKKGYPNYLFIIPERSRKNFNLDIPPHLRSQGNVLWDSLGLGFSDHLLKPGQNLAFVFRQGRIDEKIEFTPEKIEEELLYLFRLNTLPINKFEDILE